MCRFQSRQKNPLRFFRMRSPSLKRWAVIWIALLFLANLSLASTNVTILFTTKNDGTLRDCGCAIECQGGLPQRMTLLKQIRESSQNAIFLDGGDCFTTMGRQRKDETVIQIYELFDYTAIGVGDQEFINGWRFFKHKLISSKLNLISSNLFEKSTGKNVVNPYKIIDINNMRIGIASVASPSVFSDLPASKIAELDIRSVRETLALLKKRDQSKADIWILLAQLDDRELAAISEIAPWFRIIIQGHASHIPEHTYLELSDQIIVSAGVEGQYLGRLDVRIDAQKKISAHDVEFICVTTDIPSDETVAQMADAYFAEFDILSKKIGPRSKNLPLFGATYCRQCHVIEFDIWKQSRHATAFSLLMKSGKKIRPECISCHSTGKISFRDSLDAHIAPEMQHVQCEACHSFDVNQIDPAIAHHPDTVTEVDCRRCHTPEYSPNFQFDRYWKKIAH